MHSSEQEPSRRQALRDLGLGLGALTVGSATLAWASVLPAGAQSTTTTTEKPKEGLTEPETMAFLESLELTAAAAYDAATASGLAPESATTFAQFRDHHREHAQAVAAVAGAEAKGKPNAKLAQVTNDQMRQAHSAQALTKILYDLEGALAATYLAALGAMHEDVHETLAASILPVEAQHAVVLGNAIGIAGAELVPAFEIVDRAMPAETFPIKEQAK